MSRYIDADKLLDDKYTHVVPCGYGKASGKIIIFEEDIENFPTADVVEAVRCKDCKYARPITFEHPTYSYSCRFFNTHLVKTNDFCSYGARWEK